MKEILVRLSAPTPTFFKKVAKLGLIVTAIGGVLVSGIAVPPIAVTIGGYLISGGLVAAAIAKVTVADSDVLPK